MTEMLFVDFFASRARSGPVPSHPSHAVAPRNPRTTSWAAADLRLLPSAGDAAAATTSWSSVEGTTDWWPRPTSPGRAGRSWSWNGCPRSAGRRSASRSSTASTSGCPPTPTWSACCPTGSSTTCASRCGWPTASVASYTATVRDGRPGGLLVERDEGPATATSFRELTGSDAEFAGWQRFYGRLATLAEDLAPTLTEPLLSPERAGRPAPRSAAVARPARTAAGRRRRRPPRRRRRPRRGPDRRADRHLRRRARGRRPGRALLPVPPGRQRHGPLAGAGRRHGRGERRHGGGRAPRRGRAGHPGDGHRAGRHGRTASPCTGPTTTGRSLAVDAGHVVSGAAPTVLAELTGRRPRPAAVGLAAEGQHGAGPAARGCGRAPTPRPRWPAPSTWTSPPPRSTRPTPRPRPAGCPTSSRSRSTATR